MSIQSTKTSTRLGEQADQLAKGFISVVVSPASGQAYPTPLWPGKTLFQGADVPATGGTTARADNKMASVDLWLHAPAS